MTTSVKKTNLPRKVFGICLVFRFVCGFPIVDDGNSAMEDDDEEAKKEDLRCSCKNQRGRLSEEVKKKAKIKSMHVVRMKHMCTLHLILVLKHVTNT